MALLVGLTGGMGSGKSTASGMFQRLGAEVIDADALCRELMEPEQPAWREIVETFGPEILQPDQRLDRKKLAERVFSNPGDRRRLEAILHPRVFEEERRRFEAIADKNPGAVVILDAALLIESGNYRKVDQVVVVTCPEEEQVRRLLARGGFDETEIRRRLACQMPAQEKIRYANHVIQNDSTLEHLEQQVNSLYRRFSEMAQPGKV